MEHLEFGKHWIEHVGDFSFNMDTLITAWIAMLTIILLSLLVTRNLNRVPDAIQALAEMIMEFIEGIAVDQIGKKGIKHVPLIASLFLFILTANLLGQLPWKLYHLSQGELASPTNDINVTAALAVIVTIYYLGAGISQKGLKYFKHYFEPVWFMAPINFLEDFTRPLSLALRLFANILAGEIIIMVLINIFPLFLPIPIMLFELFVAFIQAFIFAVLSASYIAAVTSESH